MRELIGAELIDELGGVALQAYQVTCSVRGCLLLLATGPGADWDAINTELIQRFTADRWDADLSLRQESELGGDYPDGSGKWNMVAFERLGPR